MQSYKLVDWKMVEVKDPPTCPPAKTRATVKTTGFLKIRDGLV